MEQLARIKNKNIDYNISYRDIKHPRLEFKTGDLLLVLPKDYSEHERLLEKHQTWIYQRRALLKNALNDSKKKKLEKRSDKEFRETVHFIAEKFKEESWPKLNRIYFRKMKSKWASLSSKKNLTVNTLLKYLPGHLVEYVIYHEMAHLRERRHNQMYWNLISKRFKDFKRMEKDLLVYWFIVQNQNS